MRRAHQHRLTEPVGRVGRIVFGDVADDRAELYDPASGPHRNRRPYWQQRTLGPVNEWDDPIIDGIILRVDALAAAEKAKARIAAGYTYGGGKSPKGVHTAGYEHWLDRRQVAEQCGVTEATVNGWCYRGTGPMHVRLGNRIRFNPEAVARYAARLDRQRTQGQRPPRPTPPPTAAEHVIVRHGRLGRVYWTGVRWTPDPQAAHRYRQLSLARTLAASLHARLRTPSGQRQED